MARRNLQVEWLEKENAFLRREVAALRADPGDIPFNGCDNSCFIARPRGMATNGGCRCDEKKLRQAVLWWRRRAEFLLATLVQLRDGDSVEHWDQMAPKLRELIEKQIEREQK